MPELPIVDKSKIENYQTKYERRTVFRKEERILSFLKQEKLSKTRIVKEEMGDKCVKYRVQFRINSSSDGVEMFAFWFAVINLFLIASIAGLIFLKYWWGILWEDGQLFNSQEEAQLSIDEHIKTWKQNKVIRDQEELAKTVLKKTYIKYP